MVLPQDVLETNRSLLNLGNSTIEHMQLLVDSLLDIARMESGEVQLDLEPLDIKEIIGRSVNRPVLPIRDNVTLETDVPDSLPPVLADREKLERIMANLVGNAIKYTPGGGQIKVAANAQNSHIKISITDTGPGIPPEDRERIFERFARIKENTANRKGFGLGLAFCRLAVEAQGGKIWVEDGEGGVGSRFIFTLPAHTAEN
jgi:signal transduction histidine kinase